MQYKHALVSIGSLISEIDVKISEMWESKKDLCSVKPMPVF